MVVPEVYSYCFYLPEAGEIIIETQNGREFTSRSEKTTRAYNSLARLVKKIALYTEITSFYISPLRENFGEKGEYKHKEYVSRFCIDKMAEGYALVK